MFVYNFIVPPTIKSPSHVMLPAPGFCDNQESRLFVNEDVGVNLCLTIGTRVLLDCEVDDFIHPAPDVIWSKNGKNIFLYCFVLL